MKGEKGHPSLLLEKKGRTRELEEGTTKKAEPGNLREGEPGSFSSHFPNFVSYFLVGKMTRMTSSLRSFRKKVSDLTLTEIRGESSGYHSVISSHFQGFVLGNKIDEPVLVVIKFKEQNLETYY